MSATPPDPHPVDEMQVRLNPLGGAVLIPVGLLLTLFAAALGDGVGIALAVFLVVLGVLYLVGTAAVVRPERVEVKNPLQITVKRVPVEGFGDLRLDGRVLRRAADDKKIANLGWGTAKTSDVEALRQAIAAADPA